MSILPSKLSCSSRVTLCCCLIVTNVCRLFSPLQDSQIIDFYPVDFRVDLNGKKFAWQGVALLPFVDEERLKKALEEVYPDLTPDEGWLDLQAAVLD